MRWGDTLWDISEAFYRNPWLYPSIVRYNRIRNPNLIVSGTEITIPAR
ncbi:MAG: LysM peptidoglycan-binding domain-containing protein [Treponema sp.]|nr:LysM peptidoglycan-binding domain-containing protein [Treponema sp.]